MLISKENSILAIIDVQETLNPVMMEPREVIKYGSNLLKIAKIVGIPHIVTEQVPEKLGRTIIDIRQETSEANIIAKSSFSCTDEPEFMKKLLESGKKQVIICGIESHICVLQTAISLKRDGFEVFVAVNAVSSRKKLDYDTACNRMSDCGIFLVTYEMIAFEWLRNSEDAGFREISRNFIDRN